MTYSICRNRCKNEDGERAYSCGIKWETGMLRDVSTDKASLGKFVDALNVVFLPEPFLKEVVMNWLDKRQD